MPTSFSVVFIFARLPFRRVVNVPSVCSIQLIYTLALSRQSKVTECCILKATCAHELYSSDDPAARHAPREAEWGWLCGLAHCAQAVETRAESRKRKTFCAVNPYIVRDYLSLFDNNCHCLTTCFSDAVTLHCQKGYPLPSQRLARERICPQGVPLNFFSPAREISNIFL